MTDLIQCGLGLSLALCGGREVLHRLERLERNRRGFSLVELLVCIAIIGILIAILAPAIQFARESARRVHCSNNLRQLALAFHHHHDAVRHLPTGGWGYGWVGDDTRGLGTAQPGGWCFNVLPWIEQENIRRSPVKLITRPIALFHCPSLRRARPYPITLHAVNVPKEPMGAKVDYAANAGAGLDEWDAGSPDAPPRDWGGIVCVKSTTSLAELRDGLSNTILVAEKFLHPLHRDSGTCWGDNETLYTGLDNDSVRSTKFPPQTIGGRESYPLTFGSYHPGSFNVAMCDGRTESVSYAIDQNIWRALGTRAGMEVSQ